MTKTKSTDLAKVMRPADLQNYSEAVNAIIEERWEQIVTHRHRPEQDDSDPMILNRLCEGAEAYLSASKYETGFKQFPPATRAFVQFEAQRKWPPAWDKETFKPKDAVKNLTKAAAMILAAIEHLKRQKRLTLNARNKSKRVSAGRTKAKKAVAP